SLCRSSAQEDGRGLDRDRARHGLPHPFGRRGRNERQRQLKLLRVFPPLRSLAVRVVTLSTIWVIVALVVVATFIGSLYGEAARSNFERLLTAHLFSLVGAVSTSGEGFLQGRPELGELRYSSPLSGW